MITHLGSALSSARALLHASQGHVALDARIAKAHLSHLERGVSHNPSVSTLLGLACALEVNPHSLFAAAMLDQIGVTDNRAERGQ